MVDPKSPLPKYSQLKEYLKKRMQQGEIAFEQQLPSENELAKEFKLSRHTVRETFRALEAEGWIRREQGRGTFCIYNEKAGGKRIALVTTYISEYIFPSIIRGVEEVLSAAGVSLVLANTNNDKRKEAAHLENLLNQNIAGLIIEPTKSSMENSNLPLFKELEKRQIPYILLHALYSDLDPAFIIMDDQKGGYLATKYLLQLGHRKIGGIFKSDDYQGLKRQAGFVQALEEYDLSANPEYLGNYETEQVKSYPYQFTKRLLQKEERPTALVCYNDEIALNVMEAVRDEGLKIPDDISIVGYDDSSLATATETKLTTIRHPKTEMGRQAARFIMDMVERRVEKPRFIYHPELIIRESCRDL